jgi:hypothetical protein
MLRCATCPRQTIHTDTTLRIIQMFAGCVPFHQRGDANPQTVQLLDKGSSAMPFTTSLPQSEHAFDLSQRNFPLLQLPKLMALNGHYNIRTQHDLRFADHIMHGGSHHN